MSLFEHLEELRQRIFYALIAVVLSMIGCCCSQADCPDAGSSSSGRQVSPAPGEYFFFHQSCRLCLLIASPFVLYEIIQFVLPGLTRRERRLIGPVVLGSTVLFGRIGICF